VMSLNLACLMVAPRRSAFKISMSHKQVCNSHYLSQLATFVIESSAESSTPSGVYDDYSERLPAEPQPA